MNIGLVLVNVLDHHDPEKLQDIEWIEASDDLKQILASGHVIQESDGVFITFYKGLERYDNDPQKMAELSEYICKAVLALYGEPGNGI